MKKSILIVDDERNAVAAVARMLAVEGYEVHRAYSGDEALEVAGREPIDLALLDVRMPGRDGLSTLEALLSRDPDLPVIMMSAHGTIETAVKATQAGARDFLEKPLSTEKVLMALANTLRLSTLERETENLRASSPVEQELVGSSAAMERVRSVLSRVAASEGRVLLAGESGTGKEVAARMVHLLSPRAGGPFITVNCAAIPGELFESELFGHEKGAFTGAAKSRPGKFELAHRGTLFLDEIGDMPLTMQAKLLRVLETAEVERVGATAPRRIDVRVVAASNRDLERGAKRGEFRDDLYHRLNVVPVRLPALRERMEDFPELVDHLLGRLSQTHGKRARVLAPDALAALAGRSWPGNVRELKNALERLVILAPDGPISAADVAAFLPPPAPDRRSGASPDGTGPLRDRIREFERRTIEEALEANGGNVTATARALGLERSHLYKKMKEVGVTRDVEE
jgi:two-component system nitrogen regulation response regulator NtrX